MEACILSTVSQEPFIVRILRHTIISTYSILLSVLEDQSNITFYCLKIGFGYRLKDVPAPAQCIDNAYY